ncbi:MAG: hypothetical protein IJ113_07290 [Eggerthellaceae bacterium]|nr:hypothetical protein [Eggerthellaceae bacterium]
MKRFKDKPLDCVALEAHMLRELHRLGFIALPEETAEKFAQLPVEEIDPGHIVYRNPGDSVPYAPMFLVLPRGHYAIRELAVQLVGGFLWTFAVALLGGLAAITLGKLG